MIPSRLLLLLSGLLAIGLALFNLYHEFHAGQVDKLYLGVALALSALWLTATVAAYAGWRLGVFLAALMAFVEFGVIASAHFVSASTAALGTFVTKEGLPVATVDMALIPACLLVVMSAAVCWTNPRGRNRVMEMTALLLAALLGAVLVILQATDDLQRKDFGTANQEDGAFAAAVLASIWLAGGLWISRVRRTGALLVAIATFGVWYSFVSLHLVGRGTTVNVIATKSGTGWATVAAAAAILAGASFLAAVGILIWSIVRPNAAPALNQAARRRA